MAAKKKRLRRNKQGRFLSREESEKIEQAERRSDAAKKGWRTRRALAHLKRQGVSKKKRAKQVAEAPQRQLKKWERDEVRHKASPARKPTPQKTVQPRPADSKKKSVWFLRQATPQAKALESRRAREALEASGISRAEAVDQVKSLTRKAKAVLVRSGVPETLTTRKRPKKKKAPARKIPVVESREAARAIATTKRAIREADTKREKQKWQRALRKVQPKKRTKSAADRERTLRQERQTLADELAAAGLNIPGAPTRPEPTSRSARQDSQAWEKRAMRYLGKMAKGFSGASVTGFINPDGTVDTELIVPIPKGTTAQQVSTRLARQSSGVPRGSWMAGSILFQLRDIEDPDAWKYAEYLGLSTITSYPVSMQKVRPASVFTAVNQFSQNQADSGKLKPSKVIVRLHKGKMQPRYYLGDIEE